MASTNEPQLEEIKLPFEIRTVLTGLRGQFHLFAGVTVLAIGVGLIAGYLLGAKTFKAEAILKYTPVAGHAASDFIYSELNQVKLLDNITLLRERLKLGSRLDTIGSSVKVSISQDGALMAIAGTWDDEMTATRIANTMTDIHLERWLKVQQNQLEVRHTKVSTDLKNMDAQATQIQKVIDDLKLRVEEEQSAKGKSGKGLASARYKHIQNALDAEQKNRTASAEMTRLEKELDHAKTLASKELISGVELDKTKTAYEQQRALTVESEKTQSMRRTLDSLASAMASETETVSPTISLLNERLQKSYEIELSRITTKTAETDLQNAIDKIKKLLERTEDGKESTAKLMMTLDGGLPQLLAKTALLYSEGEGGTYEVIAFAQPPINSEKSTKRLIAGGSAFFIWIIGVLLLVGRQVTNPTVRSPAEAKQKFGLPVIGVLPISNSLLSSIRMDTGSETAEAARLMAGQFKIKFPKKGSIIAITSAERMAGKSEVCAALASALGRREELVLLIDAETREPRGKALLKMLCTAPHAEEEPDGLTDLLKNSTRSDEVIIRTRLERVSLLPRGTAVKNPEILASREMKALLAATREKFDVTIIRSAPALPWADAEILARNCDAVLLVIHSCVSKTSQVKKAIRQLENAGTPVSGLILTSVPPKFLAID